MSPSLLTDLKVKVVDTCKWTKKDFTPMRFNKLFEDLRKAAADKGSTGKMKADFYSPTIQKTNKTFSSQLNDVAGIHGRLQEEGLSRNTSQLIIDTFHKTVWAEKDVRASPT